MFYLYEFMQCKKIGIMFKQNVSNIIYCTHQDIIYKQGCSTFIAEKLNSTESLRYVACSNNFISTRRNY